MKYTILLFALALAINAHAAPKIAGGANYQFGKDNATVSISCAAISNDSKVNATGTIQVRLWALSAPYVSGQISGTVLTEYKLEGLEGGQQYSAFNKTLKASMPKAKGNYFICLTVSEYRDKGYVLTDTRNFPSQISLAPAKLFTLTGPWSWQSNPEAGTVNIKVKKIGHTRSASTGSLKLEVWACKAPYNGGQLHGIKIGGVQKEAMKAGHAYNDVNNTAKYASPGAGTYNVVLVLQEFNNGKYGIVAWLNSSAPYTFQ